MRRALWWSWSNGIILSPASTSSTGAMRKTCRRRVRKDGSHKTFRPAPQLHPPRAAKLLGTGSARLGSARLFESPAHFVTLSPCGGWRADIRCVRVCDAAVIIHTLSVRPNAAHLTTDNGQMDPKHMTDLIFLYLPPRPRHIAIAIARDCAARRCSRLEASYLSEGV